MFGKRRTMKYLILEHHPNDSRIKIVEDGICQSLTQRMGTGGGNVPLVIVVYETDNADRKEILQVGRG